MRSNRLYKSSIIMVNYVQISSYTGLQLKGRRILWSDITFVNVFALHKTAAAYTLFHIYWSNSPSRLTNLSLEQPTRATILPLRSVAPTSDFSLLNGPMEQKITFTNPTSSVSSLWLWVYPFNCRFYMPLCMCHASSSSISSFIKCFVETL